VVVNTGDVLAANMAFYAAFGGARPRRDGRHLGPRRRCGLHPSGWPTLHGWSRVGASWAALLSNGERLQFIVADELVRVCGNVAWSRAPRTCWPTTASAARSPP
jgi:hypothetical protein